MSKNVNEKSRKIKFGENKICNIKIIETLLPDTDKFYEIDKMLSYNNSYILFSIKDDDTKYIKIIKTNKFNRNQSNNDLIGLKKQFELSKKCDNICKIYEYGNLENTIKYNSNYLGTTRIIDIYENYLFSVIEKLDNFQINNFYDYIKDNISRNKEYKNIFFDILSGLKCIHSNNAFHLNINPTTIGINKKDNKAKIFDFSRTIDMENDSQNFISLNINMYTDPLVRLATSTDDVNSTCDIYSVGVILLMTFFKNDSIYNFLNYDSIKNMYKEDKYIEQEKLNLDWAKKNLRIKVGDDEEIENLINLIKNMLIFERSARFTAEEALVDKWFDTWKDTTNKGGKKTITRKKRRHAKTVRKQKTNKKIKNRK
jgi:serine/threonine protein kinase